MPYKSKAQARLFHHLESKGEMPKKTVNKFDKMTEFEDLPEHVKMALGGLVGALGDSELMEHPIDTSGEPHRDHMGDGEEEEMEHHAEGGMAGEKKGSFAKHLAKKMRGY